MTIEFRPHKQKKPSLIDGSISEVDGKRVDPTKHPSYIDHNGYEENPLTGKQVDEALKWAWEMQDQYKGTARIVLNWFGQTTPEAEEKIGVYPEVSPHYNFRENPDLDMTKEQKRRKQEMSRLWKKGRKQGIFRPCKKR